MYMLIVEDNPDLLENLIEFFDSKGHVVDVAYNGLSGLQHALDNSYDVIVLDLMLPRMDGIEVCNRLRKEGNGTPVLMLTARDTLANKLEGFSSGADDYLVKPFALPELEARLTALSRRMHGNSIQRVLTVSDLTFDEDTLQVHRGGRKIVLSPIPLKILALLMRRSPGVVGKEEIAREIWGDDPPDSDTLRAHLHSLRSAIDKDLAVQLVQTVRGLGYRVVEPDDK
ncbi:MAG: response regulator transcription factor [Candidatus Thiodiazotropha sp.]